jgi:hypothetical protein
MQYQEQTPKTDDFRLERVDGNLVVTFTPDGRSYTFRVEGNHLSEPQVSPAQAAAADYVDDEVRRIASELARLTLYGAPGQG